ncbi:MAG: alpha/beta hydrolase [Planctomycetaceae bacterium]|nr:alpha/beta hydrolase [Planctomycetaceae bacterium]
MIIRSSSPLTEEPAAPPALPCGLASCAEGNPQCEAAPGNSETTSDCCGPPIPPGCRLDSDDEPAPVPLDWRDVHAEVQRHGRDERWQHDGRHLQTLTLGEGPPLYLPCGLSGRSELFCLLAWLLKDSFRCVMIDLPAPALRGRLNRDAPLNQPVADLLDVMDRAGDETAVVYGAGFSGLVAIELTRAVPHRVAGLILQSVGFQQELSTAERFLARCGLVLPWLPIRRVPAVQTIQLRNHRMWFPPGAEDRWNYWADAAGTTPAGDVSRRLIAADRLAAAGGLPAGVPAQGKRIVPDSVPVQLLRTEGDGERLAGAADRLTAQLSNPRIAWMGGCGQLAYLTHPHRTARLVREFAAPETTASAAGG